MNPVVITNENAPPVYAPSCVSTKDGASYTHSILPYLGTALLAIVCVAVVFHLKRADLSIPLYGGRDALFYNAVVKNLVENGAVNTNAFLGAPGHQEFYDFPLPHLLHFALIRLLSLFSHNFALVENLYFLLTFPLTAVLALFTLRNFRISLPFAILASVLFAFLPYHWLRGEYHLTYSSYYVVPLMALVLLWICQGEPLFGFSSVASEGHKWVTSKGLISVTVCVLIASDTPYDAFFGAFLLVVAGASGFIQSRRRENVYAAIILLTILVATFFANLAPNLLYIHKHGRNLSVAERTPEEAEIYGLKIAQLLLPVSGHRVHVLEKVKDRYNQRALRMWVNENDFSAMGLVASLGFLVLIGWSVFFWRRPPEQSLIAPLSSLNLSAVLFGTIGGFGALFALLISPEIRGYNRICVFIAFFSLFAVALQLDGLFRKKPALWTYALSAVLLVLGILDQTSKYTAPAYSQIKAEYTSDADFVQQIENRAGRGAMIFQLPYVAFPESLPVNKMTDYELLRGYLHSKTLRWSYGAMKGRPESQWQQEVTTQPLDQMTKTLVFAGFEGIYVDGDGYEDAAAFESKLATLLNTSPMVSRDRTLSFFSLQAYRARLQGQYTKSEWQAEQDSALHPLQLEWKPGFSFEEGTANNNWRWCSSEGELDIVNGSTLPKKIRLEMGVQTASTGMAHFLLQSATFSRALTLNWKEQKVTAVLTVSPASTYEILMKSDAEKVHLLTDPREFVFRINNFSLQEMP